MHAEFAELRLHLFGNIFNHRIVADLPDTENLWIFHVDQLLFPPPFRLYATGRFQSGEAESVFLHASPSSMVIAVRSGGSVIDQNPPAR